MTETLKQKLSVKEKWIRLIFMVIFACIASWIASLLVIITAVFQFIYTLFVGKPNQTLMPFGIALSEYIKQIMLYLTYGSNEKPFPFKPWPGTKAQESAPVKASPAKKKAEPKKITATKD